MRPVSAHNRLFCRNDHALPGSQQRPPHEGSAFKGWLYAVALEAVIIATFAAFWVLAIKAWDAQ
jgi:hypothetical protein